MSSELLPTPAKMRQKENKKNAFEFMANDKSQATYE